METTWDSLQVTDGNLLEKIVHSTAQETRRTIDHAYSKALWLIVAFLLGQFFLILCAARLFRPKNTYSIHKNQTK